ncbi:hypothetical protein DPMN_093856 [Dreissena polymorpha]|uniref:Uncharacterized protein n=1 Tax=Dreissena polymorpha TaxID=45954 RepID=A0A9D4L4C1_DREPO|nr:hypothetical protein DPMN_093856 [Dreissena polymorpha]
MTLLVCVTFYSLNLRPQQTLNQIKKIKVTVGQKTGENGTRRQWTQGRALLIPTQKGRELCMPVPANGSRTASWLSPQLQTSLLSATRINWSL